MSTAPDMKRCRYDDCPEGHPVASEGTDNKNLGERVTCETCRKEMGLPTVVESRGDTTMPREKATYRVVYIVAKGNGPGIVDMLRYDSCCPATETDAAKLERSIAGRQDKPEWIVFKRFVFAEGSLIHDEPNAERWASFGWRCLRRPFRDRQEALDTATADDQGR